MIKFTTNSPDETMRLGKQLCGRIPLNTTVALSGDLGCGKTTLVKGMAQALGIAADEVNSPSYVLIKEHAFKGGNLFHLDLYRLEGVKEISMLAIEEYFTRKGMLVIEWAEKAEELMPEDYIQISIKALSENRRGFSLSAKGKRYKGLLDSLKSSV